MEFSQANQRPAARRGQDGASPPMGRVIYPDRSPGAHESSRSGPTPSTSPASFGDEMQGTTSNWEGEWDIDAHLTQRQNEYLEQSGITDEMSQRGFFEEMSRVRGLGGEPPGRVPRRAPRPARPPPPRMRMQDDVAFKNLEGECLPSSWRRTTALMSSPRQVRGLYKDLGQEGTLGMGYDKLDRWG